MQDTRSLVVMSLFAADKLTGRKIRKITDQKVTPYLLVQCAHLVDESR